MSITTSETRLPQAAAVDVLLLLEGTFPYVAGGVSSWVNQIVRGFPQLRFGAIFIGSRREDYGTMRYALPDNLLHLDCIYLFDEPETADQVLDQQSTRQANRRKAGVRRCPMDAATHAQVKRLHELFLGGLDTPECQQLFAGLLDATHADGALAHEVFLHSPEAWDFIKRSYRSRSTDPSFIDYFWTVRTLHTPFWALRAAAARAPQARVLHTVSTGYAGVLGLLLKQRTGRPFVLTEHGIYVKERKIDLYQAQWIRDNRNLFECDPSQLSYFRQLWLRFFSHLGYLTYQSADEIIALFEANRQRQISDGAPAERTRSIANGISLERFAPALAARPAKVPPVLCLIGRVVPIKDVKTYLRAMRKVLVRLPEAQAWIAGPLDEDPDYVAECQALVQLLGLQGRVQFLGQQDMAALLPKIGLVVLSSISEALPLVLLEGFAAGVPAVATDVGACRELIDGAAGEDAALGRAGRVVRIADPEALANAALELLLDDEAWQQASRSARARVAGYYSQDLLFERYGALYEKHVTWQA